MLLRIVPQYLNEMYSAQRAGRMRLESMVTAIHYVRDITHAEFAQYASRIHKLDFHPLLPKSTSHKQGGGNQRSNCFVLR